MSENYFEVRMRNVENLLTRIESKLDTALTDINDHEERLRSLECKPAKRWESLVGQIIALGVSGLIGYFLAK